MKNDVEGLEIQLVELLRDRGDGTSIIAAESIELLRAKIALKESELVAMNDEAILWGKVLAEKDKEIERLKSLIKDHNEECQAACFSRRQVGRCDKDGKCFDCPMNDIIEVPK